MKYFVVIVIILCPFYFYGQNAGYPLITNFNNKDFGVSNSNFSVTQDKKGIIYGANFEGLITFNGNSWQATSPDQTIISSIYYSDFFDLLFYGSKNDFGIFISDSSGDLNRFSLSQNKINDKEQFVVWQIIENQNGEVLFLATNGLYSWNGKSVNKIEGKYYNQFFEIDRSIFLPDQDSGIVQIKNGSIHALKETIKLSKKRIELITGGSDSLQIVTGDKYAYKYISGELSQIKSQDSLLSGDIHFGTTLSNGSIALGYAKNGMQIIGDNNLVISKSAGLGGEFVKFIFQDNEKNLWLAMQEGISLINSFNSIRLSNENNRLIGSTWASSYGSKYSLIGTTAGLFMLNTKGAKRVSDIDHHVTAIKKIKGTVLVGTRKGLYNFDSNTKTTDLIYDDRALSLIQSYSEDTVLIASLSGLKLLVNKGGTPTTIESISIPSNTYNSMVIDEDRNIWISAKFNGLYKWDFKKNETFLYDNTKGIENTFYTKLVLLDGVVHVFSSDGFYRLNVNTNTFEIVFKYNKTIQYVSTYSENQFLIAAKDKYGDNTIDLIEVSNDQYRVISRKFNGFNYSDITDIEKDDDGNLWFSTPEGLFKYVIDNDFDHNLSYNTLVGKVSILDSVIFHGHYTDSINGLPRFVIDQPNTYKPQLDYSQNALKFEYGAPYFTQNDKIKFRYYLEGNDEDWSAWTKDRGKEYNNLGPGKYKFHVKSINVFDIEGRTASYSFTILPPWYMTTWAYTIFTLGGLGLIWFIVLAYSYRVRQQRKKLKLIVADRTFEVLSQKKEIEKQNKKLKNQNEEISKQRDAINEKNQELQMSQEEILSINDRLQELNSSLEKKVEDRTSKIKTTVKQLQKTIAELDTFIYRASHDLKGPISRINGLTSLAKLEATNPNDVKYYELIDLVAKDMGKLLAKLTQVHEVINNKVQRESVDLPVLITEVRKSIEFLDMGNVSKYSFNLQGTLEIKSDPFLMSVIFTNLMENSLIFKKPWQEDHEIKIHTYQDSRHYSIEIEDNGVGIQDEHLSRIFDMFYRGSDQSKGNGLGLYLTKMAVEKLQGKIEVESEFEKFTRFTISLPK